ncbi:glycosyltransferase family 25 protein [Acinetobacter sp. 10FS3-1]|uniref:glycosyltransferase family 25 protein n=1 Tax=Acinetobacter sp. 10FS3-1 TaxID=2563897 RepID=UPI00157D135F|nr:glycosyltransferase family 25 protein [Acinetobacter sp. 10FS3-1]MDM1780764.1 glycosyltransferase family 25 protein [Acinetobacter indicus]QKQ69253.1 glycosyltransferase family 25 protein [Acinetobacter sp. 10FS3-1]
MKNIVISLKSATARREHIVQEFGKQNIEFEFFDALTPDLARPLAEKMQLNIQNEFLSPGELACFMSHVSIWQKMVDEQIPYMAIFEDDVYLGEAAAELLNNSAWISPKWDIIKTEAFANQVFLGKTKSEIAHGMRHIVQLTGKNLGTAGYILSLKGAQKYLQYVGQIQLIPLDQVMFNEFIRHQFHSVYQMTPALCIQEMILFPEKKTILSSDLLAERKARMKKQKKKGWAKVQLEILRILKQVKYALVGQRVEFK